ncbi:DUF4202 family protein [Thermodesulfobacteriota bacterium]
MNEFEKSELIKKVEQFLVDSFGPDHISTPHLKRTAYWARVLDPDADEAVLIAALSHDIQRAEGDRPAVTDEAFKDFNMENYLTYHQEKGGAIMEDFLIRSGASVELAKKVKYLISRHELGGNNEQDLIRDADSISFLENLVDSFIKEKVPDFGFEDVKKKFQWMFDRIGSDKAKQLAEPFFKDAMKKLMASA